MEEDVIGRHDTQMLTDLGASPVEQAASNTTEVVTSLVQPRGPASTPGRLGVALGRKTFLFVGGKRGGENLAILHSLVTSCEQNGKNPLPCLTDVRFRVADHPASRLDEPLPDRWQPPDRAG